MSTATPDTPNGGLLRQLRRLVGTPATSPQSDADHSLDPRLLGRLDAIERALVDIASHSPVAPAPAVASEEVTAVRDAVAALEKQIGRAGREQLKANTLAESQAARLDSALTALMAADERREEELATLREQAQAAEDRARLDVVRAILPALDGLDEALRSGQQLLATPAAPPPPGLFARLFGLPAPPAPDTGLRDRLDAWLSGLTYVRLRLLDVLAAEGVLPIETVGQPFDPQLHVALEVAPATPEHPPGTVVAEHRRGYLLGDRPLRYAEVVVSREL